MLALLVPWCKMKMIKTGYKTFMAAFVAFESNTSERICKIMSGIQYHYDCKDAAVQGSWEETRNLN